MPRGDKSAYTDKEKRMARHIEESYVERGIPEDEAAARAWATVNKETGGGKLSGAGRGHAVSHASARKGGRSGGQASAARPASARSESAKQAAARRTPQERSASAKKAAATRKRNAAAAQNGAA